MAVPGVERIRAIADEDGMYTAFDAYPWTKDRTFLDGLSAILGDPSDTESRVASLPELADYARIFYYAQVVGVQIDATGYKDWLAKNPKHKPPRIVPDEYYASSATPAGPKTADGVIAPTSASKLKASSLRGESTSAVPVVDLTNRMKSLSTDAPDDGGLAWQKAAPKAELYIDRKRAMVQLDGTDSREGGGSGDSGGSDEPNYPLGFAQMLEMLAKGEPIPGIRDIPDTVVRDPSVKPFGTRAVPRKPWERDVISADSTQREIVPSVDQEFPPLADETENESAR